MVMDDALAAAAVRRPVYVIEPPRGWVRLNLGELWDYRELLWFFTIRNMKARYKQSVLGPLWIVIIPLLSSGLFSLIFAVLAGLESETVPYPVFVYSGMLMWGLFSRSLSAASGTLTGNQGLITKVYFPRLILPLSSSLGSMVDFILGFMILCVLLAFSGVTPGWPVLLLPMWLLLAIVAGTGAGLWLGSMSVRVRDLQYAGAFLQQIWMWLTPVAYSGTLLMNNDKISPTWRPLVETLYQLNPVYWVVEGFRWSMFGQSSGQPGAMLFASLGLTVVMVIGGLHVFRRVESTFADVV